MQPRPVAHACPHERTGPRRDEARQQCVPDHAGRDHAALGDQLEQQERSDERSPEERGDRRERAREHEQARLGRRDSREVDCDRAEGDPERDERRLRAEHEAEPERGEGGEQDAGEVHGTDVSDADPLERGMPAVPREPQGGDDEHPRERRHEHDVPPRGLAPAELLGSPFPDQVREVVDRRLEEDGGERDGDAEHRREDERPDVRSRGQLGAGGWLAAGPIHGPILSRRPDAGGRPLDKGGHRADEPHLRDGLAVRIQKPRGADEHRAALCPRGRDVEPVAVEGEADAARRVVRRRARHRDEHDRRLLALELVHRPDRDVGRQPLRSRRTWALYGATTRTSAGVSARVVPSASVNGDPTSAPTAPATASASSGDDWLRPACSTGIQTGPFPSATERDAVTGAYPRRPP